MEVAMQPRNKAAVRKEVRQSQHQIQILDASPKCLRVCSFDTASCGVDVYAQLPEFSGH